jgi:hypothetical protein
LNPGRRGGKPATNRLSSGAAKTSQTVEVITTIQCDYKLLTVFPWSINGNTDKI